MSTPALRANGIKFGTNDTVIYAEVFGAVGDNSTDNTTALQNAMNAATANNATLVIPAGIYKCGQITDTSAGKLEIQGTSGTIINTTASTWLKVVPTAGKTGGVRITDLTITATSGYAAMTPLLWLEGASTGGILSVDINNLTFNGGGTQASPIYFDCMWLRGVFNGSVSRIFGSSLYGSRGIVYEANGINSGNVHFDSIALADSPVSMTISGAGGVAGAGTTSSLLNTVALTNFKCVRTVAGAPLTDAAPYNAFTLTAGASSGATSVTVSGADATTINTALANGNPQWMIAGDVNGFDQAVRITAANTGSGVLTLASGLRYALANSTIVGVGSFGVVVGGNARGVDLRNPHFEETGCGVYAAGPQHLHVDSPQLGLDLRRGLVATNGAQNCKLIWPIFSLANTRITLLEVTAQGTNDFNSLIEPAGFASGAGPAAYLSDLNGTDNNAGNRYLTLGEQSILRSVSTDPLNATPASRPKANALGEVVVYVTDGRAYICTTYAFNPTWRRVAFEDTMSGVVAFAGGITASGSTANNFGGSTGDFTASTGALTWAGASGKAASLVSTAAAMTVTAGAASTWSTSAGALTVDGFAGVNVKNNGTAQLDAGVTAANTVSITGTGGLAVNNAGAAAVVTVQKNGATAVTLDGTPEFFPAANNSGSFIGTSSHVWANLFANRCMVTPQTIAAAASITINPASGDKVRINLSATAITSLTISAGNDSEIMRVIVAQDGTGGRSIPTTWTNVRFAGGTYTATATLNKIDVLEFVYDATAAAWLETARAMNM